MDGEITVTSVAGKGSTFTATFPVQIEDPQLASPDVDISDAAIVLLGLSDQLRGNLERQINSAGIVDLHNHNPGQAEDHLTKILEAADGPVTVISDARDGTSIDLAAELQQRSRADRIRIVRLSPRTAVSDLTLKPGRQIAADLPLPTTRRQVWHCIALALGRIDPSKVRITDGDIE